MITGPARLFLTLVLTLLLGTGLATAVAAPGSRPDVRPDLRPGSAEGARPGLLYTEMFFSVEARIDRLALEAEVEAAGRLLMAEEAPPSAATGPPPASDHRALSLIRPLEHPWKLYRVDPLGPGRGESKHAAVITLPEVTWEALETARAEMDRLGEARARNRHPPWPLAGTFSFVVIGPPEGRFRVEIGPPASGSRVLRVENRLTDRWLPGDFDTFVAAWRHGEARGLPEGYWFWNRGENEPFPWEPHTYHAFAAALALLGDPAPVPGASVPALRVELPDLAERLARVLAVLVPKSAGRLPAAGGLAVCFQPVSGEAAGGGRAVLGRGCSRATSDPAAGESLVYERFRGLGSDSGRLSVDRVRASFTSPAARVTVEVGFRPHPDPSDP